jgi:hypothetical protein
LREESHSWFRKPPNPDFTGEDIFSGNNSPERKPGLGEIRTLPQPPELRSVVKNLLI